MTIPQSDIATSCMAAISDIFGLHKKIRKAAIERGNPQMVLTPEFEAIYITNREDAFLRYFTAS